MADEGKIRGIEQGRANMAYEFVKSVLKNDEKTQKQYKSGVKKLPVYIKNNGLGQSLAFYEKHNDAYDLIYSQLAEWLQKHDEKKLVGEGELVQEVIKMSSSEYRHVGNEAMALLLWMRRFVDGLIEGED